MAGLIKTRPSSSPHCLHHGDFRSRSDGTQAQALICSPRTDVKKEFLARAHEIISAAYPLRIIAYMIFLSPCPSYSGIMSKLLHLSFQELSLLSLLVGSSFYFHAYCEIQDWYSLAVTFTFLQ